VTIEAKSEPMARKWGLTNVLLPGFCRLGGLGLRRPGCEELGCEDLGLRTAGFRRPGLPKTWFAACIFTPGIPQRCFEASAFAHLLSSLYHSWMRVCERGDAGCFCPFHFRQCQ